MIHESCEHVAGVSFKALLIGLIVVMLLGIYMGIIIYGENSLPVLQRLEKKESQLHAEIKSLQDENRRLQKYYFELKQLEPEARE